MMGCIGMSEGMDGGLLGDFCIFSCLPHSPLSGTDTIPFAFDMTIEKIIDRFQAVVIICENNDEASRNTDVSIFGTFAFADSYLEPVSVYIIEGDIECFT